MAETKRADEIEPGDVVALSRMQRMNVVERPPNGWDPPEGQVILWLQAPDSKTITPLELAGHAEAEQIADGAWWL